ncbi:histidine phosphatase family protein [uncultured Abyssibacter sp.]|uniref:SixA phosphatase family protein n=1 Tax=uncultured Abyssibacter sp. TaxID=2320202 RepID=UPI0032B298C7
MIHLTLIRHGKSDWNQPGIPDFDRSLNARGRHDIPMMAQRWRDRHPIPDQVISSPAVRAATTTRGLLLELDQPTDGIDYQAALYLASPETIWRVIRERATGRDIWVVGHNEGLSELAAALVPLELPQLPTCSWMRCALDLTAWPEQLPKAQARLIELATPKGHRDIRGG